MLCPGCRVELKQKKIKDVGVRECQKCKGIWFEGAELRNAKDSMDPDLSWMDFDIWKHQDEFKATARNLACPKCRKSLVAVNYGDTAVEIDYCPDCDGTWLDRGEFEKIIRSLTDELVTKSFSDYVRASIKEATEIISGPESRFSEWRDFMTVIRMMQLRLFSKNKKLLDSVAAIQRANPFK